MGINNLKDVKEKKGDSFLKNLLNNYVIINEKIEGAFFGVKKMQNDSFKYFKKSGEIRYVDRVLMKYYNPAISFFENLSLLTRQKIPANFYFGFQYFSNGTAHKNNYAFEPKNNLVLSYIHRLTDDGKIESTIQNKEQLTLWADYLEVEPPPIIFEGKLTDEQKTEILDFVYSNNKNLLKKFKTTSFTKYILGVLDEGTDSSFLREDLDRNIETIVFRFYDESEEKPKPKVFLAKLVDPLFNEKNKEYKTTENKSKDYIWLIVIDLMNHIEIYNLIELEKYAIGDDFDEKYLSLINAIFIDFINEYSEKYEGVLLEIPEYLQRPEFELDFSLIKNKEIIKLIKKNETYKEIYKVLLNFFRRTRKKSSSSFFTPELITQLNLIVNKIRNIIMGNKVYEGLFPSFNEFIGVTNGDVILSEKEAASELSKKVKEIKVNILVGKFQPVSIGHIKAAEQLKNKNGKKVIFIAIKPKKPNKNSPFSLEQTRIFLEKTQQEYPELIEDIKIIESGQIEDVLETLKPKYTPILWGTSNTRVNDYAIQFDYLKKRNIPIRLSKEFKLVKVPAYLESNEILDVIKNLDFNEFKKLVPSPVTSQFFNLNKELKKILESKSSFKNLLNGGPLDGSTSDARLIEKDIDSDSK
jgi:hypothetical protein